jgi:hypothetical protein
MVSIRASKKWWDVLRKSGWAGLLLESRRALVEDAPEFPFVLDGTTANLLENNLSWILHSGVRDV